MKLSELIVYYNTIKNLSLGRTHGVIDTEVKQVIVDVKSKNVVSSSNLEDSLNNLQVAAKRVEDELLALQASVLEQLKLAELPMLQHSYLVFDKEKDFDHPSYIAKRSIEMLPEGKDAILSCIRHHASWQWPALAIQPITNPFLNEMVACDPLYIIDQTIYLLDPVVKSFYIDYQRRLRKHLFRHSNSDRFKNLPKNQFGLIIAIGFFNHTPFEVMREYLTELLQTLRPGGAIGFTFNDCDRYEAVQHVEANCAAYTPGRLVLPLLEMLGYEVINTTYINGSSTWVEAKRPGTLSSIRGNQCLAKILDTRETPFYN